MAIEATGEVLQRRTGDIVRHVDDDGDASLFPGLMVIVDARNGVHDLRRTCEVVSSHVDRHGRPAYPFVVGPLDVLRERFDGVLGASGAEDQWTEPYSVGDLGHPAGWGWLYRHETTPGPDGDDLGPFMAHFTDDAVDRVVALCGPPRSGDVGHDIVILSAAHPPAPNWCPDV